MHIKKNKNGFVLLDVILWLSISSIIITIFLTGIGEMFQLTTQSNDYASEQSLLISLNKIIMSDIAKGIGDIFIDSNTLFINGVEYRKQEGQIARIKDNKIIKFGPGGILPEIITKNEQNYLKVTLTKKHLKLVKCFLIGM